MGKPQFNVALTISSVLRYNWLLCMFLVCYKDLQCGQSGLKDATTTRTYTYMAEMGWRSLSPIKLWNIQHCKLKGPLQSEPSPAPFQERILLHLADLTVFFVSVRACHIYSIFLNEMKHNCASLFLTSDAYKVDSYLAIFKSVTRFMFFSWCVHSVFAGVIGNHSQTNKAVRVCFSTAATTRFSDQLWTLDMSKKVNTVSHFFSHSCGTVFISLRGCGRQKLHVLKEAAIAIKQS